MDDESETRQGIDVLATTRPPAVRSFLADYSVALGLVVLAVLIGGLAQIILPDSTTASVQNQVQRIALVGPLSPTAVDVYEQPSAHGVTVSVYLRARSS